MILPLIVHATFRGTFSQAAEPFPGTFSGNLRPTSLPFRKPSPATERVPGTGSRRRVHGPHQLSEKCDYLIEESHEVTENAINQKSFDNRIMRFNLSLIASILLDVSNFQQEV